MNDASTSSRLLPGGFQRWRSLLFVHWEVPVDHLRALVPPPLEIDTHAGKAYVGLIPFDIPEVRPVRGLPRVPTAGRFLEVNLRTYVRLAGRPGVWFFSLDAASGLAVLGARALFGLPYFRAEMHMTTTPDEAHYESRRTSRLFPPGLPATLEVDYRVGADVGGSLGIAAPGSLEHFLVERYTLYARHPLVGLVRGEVRHQPYPLRQAEVTRLRESLTAAAGIRALGPQPPALWSPGVDVDLSPPLRPLAAPAQPAPESA